MSSATYTKTPNYWRKSKKMSDLIERAHSLSRGLSNIVMDDDADLVDELITRIEELTGLLKAASCPNCNGDGAYYDNMGGVHQCQWCDEAKKALIKTVAQEKSDD